MEIQHVNARLFFDGPIGVDAARLIQIFHAWVREQVFPEILVDVADYRHVPNGPALMVIGHEADYVIDHGDGRPGLRYNRKAALAGSNADRFTQAIRSVAAAAKRLQEGIGDDAVKFGTKEMELTVADRALAPNTPETFAACKADIERSLTDLLGHGDFALTHRADSRRLFGVTVELGTPFDPAAPA